MSKRSKAPAAAGKAEEKKKAKAARVEAPQDIIEIFEKRYEKRRKEVKRIISEAEAKGERVTNDENYHLEAKKRKKNNAETLFSWADGAFKRWQVKMRDAGVERVSATGYQELSVDDKAVAADKNWVLAIGPSFKSRGTTFSVGAGDVVDGLKDGEWSLGRYSSIYAHSHPVMFYAKKPSDLWPGSSIDNYRDCALLMAAGVRFQIYHRSQDHPKYRSDIGKDFQGLGEWSSYEHFDSVLYAALNDRELAAGLVAVAERMVRYLKTKKIDERTATLRANIAKLQQQLDSAEMLRGSMPALGAALL